MTTPCRRVSAQRRDIIRSLDGPLVRRLLFTSCIAALLLTSCGQTPSLWRTYSTPTAEFAIFTSIAPTEIQPSFTPTLLPLPTRTFTSTPTLVPILSSTPSSSNRETPGAPRLEGTSTPTFDVAAMLYYAQSGDTLAALALR